MSSQDETEKILCDLIEYESISARSNRDIVEYVDEYFSNYGISCLRLWDSTGSKASLLASIGPSDRAGIVLSAHTDVVPVEGQAWSSPPFVATHRDGRVIGRGATDMKGFIACVLAHVARLRAAATETPVHIALSYDEEIGCRGAPDLVAAVAALPAKPALCIVGEPTGLRVVRAHKGKVARRVIVRGRGGHSALPHSAANAVVAAARIVYALAGHAEQLTQSGPRDEAFDQPWTTLHVGSLRGGTALNVVPDHAALEFEIRAVPGADVPALLAAIDGELDAVRADLKRQAPEADIVVEEIAAYPALATAADSAAVATVARLAGDDRPAGTVSFGTEAGLYAAAGIPTVVCGPGDIARAHKADEWIGLDELAAADRMMARLAAMLRRPAADWIVA
jgi:acetylornithine deacetylase